MFPNQRLVGPFQAADSRELPRNRVNLDVEEVPFKHGRLDPSMLDQAPKSWSLPL